VYPASRPTTAGIGSSQFAFLFVYLAEHMEMMIWSSDEYAMFYFKWENRIIWTNWDSSLADHFSPARIHVS